MKKIFTVLVLAFSFSAAVLAAEKSAEAFDRGVGKMNSVFIPKGYIGGGLSFSYKTYDLGSSANDVGYSMLFSLAYCKISSLLMSSIGLTYLPLIVFMPTAPFAPLPRKMCIRIVSAWSLMWCASAI